MIPRLSGPMFLPRSGTDAKSAVILLHGYGSDGKDLIPLGHMWSEGLRDTVFIAPNGPTPCDINPAGFQWFALDLEDPRSRLTEARAAAPIIVQFLEDLWQQTGLTAADTVLAGFSRGAMMALHVGLILPEPPAGILAFSGALIPPEHPAATRPPIQLIHGEFDEVVDPGESRNAEKTLSAEGYEVALHVSPGIGHSISPDGIETATAFLHRVLKH